MLTTKRLLLGLLVLGIVGMHGLVTSSGTTAAHHGWTAAPATVGTLVEAHVHDAAVESAPADDGEDSTTALALCMTLLLAFGAVAFRGRRTTWVAASVRTGARISLPLPPVLRDSTPVPRFTVMRC